MQQIKLLELNSYESPIRYYGSKKKLWPEFKDYLPTDVDRLISPFIGGGSIELLCAVQGIQVQASDNFEPLVNFWRHFLSDANLLVTKTLEMYPLSDEDRLFYHTSRLSKDKTELYTDLERAVIFWCLNKQSFSGNTLAKGGRGIPVKPSCFEKFSDWKNDNISVNCLDCFSVIEQADTFMYLDPPYIGKEDYYGASGSDRFFDHERLAKTLKEVKVPWIMSYGDHDVIRKLYRNYNILQPEWKYTTKNKGNSPKCSELLILNI